MVFEILLYTFVTAILSTIVIVYLKVIRPQKRIYDIFRAQGIPGEPFVPIVGQLSEIRRYRKIDAVMEFSQDLTKKHGNVFLFGFGPTIRLAITEPELLADVYSRANTQNYIKPPIFNTVFAPIIGEQNLLVAEGETHERARRMINPAFHHINLKSMISIITDQTAKAIEDMFGKTKSGEVEQTPVDLQVEFNTLTLSIISSSAFGSGYETLTNSKDILCRTFSTVLDAIVYRSLILVNQIPIISRLPFWKKGIVDDGARLIANLVDRIIADRRQERSSSMSNNADLLDLLLSAVDNEGKPFTDQEIKEQALTFVVAGSETTGNLMSWMFYILMTHEDVLAACREEVDRILPNGIEPTNEHLSELVICEAIINETLRLYPPAPIVTRYCVNEHVIGTEGPIHIPVGATILINNYVLHRRNDLWPRADEFDYTRWIRDPKTGLKPKLPHAFAYLPFAAGARNCIGQNFALLEAKIMLAMFVQRCNFELVPGQKIVPEFKITMRPKYGLWLKVSKRNI
jgi:cytochrome P450